jgi:hypothetical protein
MFYADMMSGSVFRIFVIVVAALLVTIFGCAGTGAFDDNSPSNEQVDAAE